MEEVGWLFGKRNQAYTFPTKKSRDEGDYQTILTTALFCASD